MYHCSDWIKLVVILSIQVEVNTNKQVDWLGLQYKVCIDWLTQNFKNCYNHCDWINLTIQTWQIDWLNIYTGLFNWFKFGVPCWRSVPWIHRIVFVTINPIVTFSIHIVWFPAVVLSTIVFPRFIEITFT